MRLRVDGGMRFSRDVLIGAILGADEFGFGTASLVAIGCVMARQCHLNTCPVGIATQDETLRTRFNGKPEMVATYFRALAEEIRAKMAELGVRNLTELRGWYDRLGTRSGLDALLVIPVSKPARVMPARCGSKARTMSSPTATSCTFGSRHDQEPVSVISDQKNRKFSLRNLDLLNTDY